MTENEETMTFNDIIELAHDNSDKLDQIAIEIVTQLSTIETMMSVNKKEQFDKKILKTLWLDCQESLKKINDLSK